MTPGTNGVHSMEEILADIRRKAAERNASRMAVADRFGAVASAAAVDDVVALNEEIQVPEPGDLPSILRAAPETVRSRPSNVQPLRPASPLRLLDALRGIDAEEAAAMAVTAAPAKPASATSSAPAPELVAAPAAAAPSPANDEPVKRVMASFLDTRMRRMSSPTSTGTAVSAPESPAPSNPAPCGEAPERADAPSTAQENAVEQPSIWGQPDAVAPPDMLLGQAFALVAALREDVDQSRVGPDEAPVAAGHTTATTVIAHARAPVASPQEHAAELLRPMLRQWLADNMPRIVEKALHMELADSLKSGSRNS